MKIIGLAYNYKGYDHDPIIFMKRGLVEDGASVKLPKGHIWPEVELGFRIGDGGRIVTYVLANDMTIDMDGQDCHLAQSKCRDGFLPLTEIMTPKDPNNVRLYAYLNGQCIIVGHTKDRVLDEQKAIRFIERYMKLESGDIVLTGCPPHTKEPLLPGDKIVLDAMEHNRVLGRLVTILC